jgi:predicted permease
MTHVIRSRLNARWLAGITPISPATVRSRVQRYWDELRISVRTLLRAKAFAFAVISALAIGIALETVVISVVNAYLVRSLPYPAADRLYRVSYAAPGQSPPSDLENLDWSSLADIVEHSISWDLDAFYLLGGDYPERALGAWVTPGFMRGLGLQPAIGRAFTAEEFTPGGPQVALISNDLWMTRFGGDTAALGRRFQANTSDRPHEPEMFTIVGVLPSNFWHLNTYTQILTPLRASSYPYLVRLRANAPSAVAERRITDLIRDADVDLPAGWSVRLQSLQAEYASRVKPLLQAIGASVTLVMLIACSNAALLMLLRGMRRRKEVSLRLALGASTTRVARILLSESIILVGTATVIGGSLAWIAIRWLAPMIEHQLGRRVPGGPSAISIDGGVLAMITALAVSMVVLLSLAPFFATARQALFSMLRQGRPIGGEGSRGRGMRFTLIALEVAGSFALLVGCGLMTRTVAHMLDVDLGLDPRNVVTAQMAIREQSYPDVSSRLAFYERLVHDLTGGALTTPSPLASFEPRFRVEAEGIDARVSLRAVTADYFTTLGAPIVAGRAFTAADRGSSEPVAIVSESVGRLLWPAGLPLGKRIRMETSPDDTARITRTVVGIARDVRQSPTDQALADVYVPFLQVPPRYAVVVRRTNEPLSAWSAGLRRAVEAIDPTVTVSLPERLGDVVEDQLGRPRFLASLFAAFGIFATVLGVMGLYTVIAYAVKQREQEIALRMALGASSTSILGLFAREGTHMLFVGLLIGVVGVLGVGRLLEAQLFGVGRLDATTIVVTAFGLAAACVAACTLPARKAGRIDPIVALRAE